MFAWVLKSRTQLVITPEAKKEIMLDAGLIAVCIFKCVQCTIMASDISHLILNTL
jgi:hypothetical protein